MKKIVSKLFVGITFTFGLLGYAVSANASCRTIAIDQHEGYYQQSSYNSCTGSWYIANVYSDGTTEFWDSDGSYLIYQR